MKRKKTVDFEDRTLYEKSYGLFGELLLQRMTESLETEIDANRQSGNAEEMEAFFARYDARNRQVITTYFRKKKQKRFLTQTLPRIGQAAAVFIAVIALVGTVAVAASRTVRIRVMRLLYTIEEEYTELSLQEDLNASFEAPAAWEGKYYPAFLPEGLEVYDISSMEDSKIILFADSETQEKKLFFMEGSTSSANMDTEGAAIRQVSVRGYDAILASKEDYTGIAWGNGSDYFIIILYEENPELAQKIAESVFRIK